MAARSCECNADGDVRRVPERGRWGGRKSTKLHRLRLSAAAASILWQHLGPAKIVAIPLTTLHFLAAGRLG